MFGNTAVFLLVALAAERYVAVVRPLSLQKRRVSPFACSLLCLLLAWALATLLAVPDIFTHNMEDLLFTEDDAGTFVLLRLCVKKKLSFQNQILQQWRLVGISDKNK